MYLELTRRNYISLLKKLIMGNTDLLSQVNVRMLKIIMAKELRIEETLKSIDQEMGPDAIEQHFLDSFTFDKKTTVNKVFDEEKKRTKEQILRNYHLTKSLSGFLIDAAQVNDANFLSEEIEIIKTKTVLKKVRGLSDPSRLPAFRLTLITWRKSSSAAKKCRETSRIRSE